MKKICHILTIIAVGLSAVMFSSCEKESEWGVRKVYMPQAAINNNTNHEYYVPMSGQQNDNYSISDGKLNVFLGVYRSGQGDLQSYTVDVYYDADASTSAASTSADRVVLSADYFTIPATVTVEDGSRQNTFYLTIDLEKLKADHPEYNTKMMVVAVGIANPTKYELNEDISKTIVVIDGSKFI